MEEPKSYIFTREHLHTFLRNLLDGTYDGIKDNKDTFFRKDFNKENWADKYAQDVIDSLISVNTQPQDKQ